MFHKLFHFLKDCYLNMQQATTTSDNCAEQLRALKCCVIIPTYNNAQKLEAVIEAVKEYTTIKTDVVFGTKAYLAPEFRNNLQRKLSTKLDVYSFGVVSDSTKGALLSNDSI